MFILYFYLYFRTTKLLLNNTSIVKTLHKIVLFHAGLVWPTLYKVFE